MIVTRPAREAARWVRMLHARGVDAVALPLIDIAPLLPGMSPGDLDASNCTALMFVSAAAVEGFFETNRLLPDMDRARPAIDLIANARCWVTGPGTAQALVRAGVPMEYIDQPPLDAAHFDSEALWTRVRGQVTPGAQVLFVRGGNAAGRATGRDWLARAVEHAGGAVRTAVVYRRLPPRLDDSAQALAAAAAAGGAHVWLFSSSEAVANLQVALPGIAWRAACAWVTHPRIAQAARAAGFGAVTEVHPSVDAVVTSIESTG